MPTNVLVGEQPLRTLPTVSYGPFRFLEAVPWLMFAAAMRLLAYRAGAAALPLMILASFALFLAFLLVARRMIELTDGCTELGTLSFGKQLALARKILLRFILLAAVAWLSLAAIGLKELGPYFVLGFDGIAFDQRSKLGMVWSSILAAIVLLMVVRAGYDGEVSLREALRELIARSAWLLPAIAAVVLLQLGLSFVQGVVRQLVALFWQTSSAPQSVKNLVYFAFIFGFAAVRLWAMLALLTFALRESYRRTDAP